MTITNIFGWVGFGVGLTVCVPQIVKTLQTRSVKDVSLATFVLILITCLCFLVRAIAIKESAFILYNAVVMLLTVFQLILIRKFRK